MKPIIPTITIPATAEASSEYRLAQSQASVEREGLKRIGKTIFSRGKPLDPNNCLMETSIDEWTPMEGRGGLKNVIPVADQRRLDKLFSVKGLAATIAMTDTVAGVTEQIEYDENESIVMGIISDGLVEGGLEVGWEPGPNKKGDSNGNSE